MIFALPQRINSTMWNSAKDYPLSCFFDGFGRLVGSLLLFFLGCVLAFLLTMFDPRSYHSLSDSLLVLTLAWFYPTVLSAMTFVGIPLICVHVWTLYRFLYTEESRVKLVWVVLATHSAICISVAWIMESSESLVRGLISIAVVVAGSFTMKKLQLFKPDA